MECMYNKCCIATCPNHKGGDHNTTGFYPFPADQKRRVLWMVAILNPDVFRVCSNHFVDSDFAEVDARKKRGPKELKDEAFPSQKLPHTVTLVPVNKDSVSAKPSKVQKNPQKSSNNAAGNTQKVEKPREGIIFKAPEQPSKLSTTSPKPIRNKLEDEPEKDPEKESEKEPENESENEQENAEVIIQSEVIIQGEGTEHDYTSIVTNENGSSRAVNDPPQGSSEQTEREESSGLDQPPVEKKYKCIVCDKAFEKFRSLATHRSTHYRKSQKRVAKGARKSGKREIHTECDDKHTPEEKGFVCDACGLIFASESKLSVHMAINHESNADPPPYMCEICGKMFVTQIMWKMHNKTHTEGKKFLCDTCGKNFQTRRMLKIHMATHTGFPTKCKTCGEEISSRRSMFYHNKQHAARQMKLSTCEFCNRVFNKRSKLARHRMIHTGQRPYKCDICGKTFCERFQLKSHLGTHSRERPYQCDICSKKFRLKTSLEQHFWMHAGEKPFECGLCGKQFTYKSSCVYHVKTHDQELKNSGAGETPLTCMICGALCGSKWKLTSHMRTHNGERPHVCKTCGKFFKTSTSLVMHNRIHTGEKPFQCDICDKGFVSQGKLKNHRMVHTGERPFSCPVCGKGFIQRNACTLHMKLHAKKEQELAEKSEEECEIGELNEQEIIINMSVG